MHPTGGDASLLHRESTFEFVAQAPLQRVAPLFGADAERVWEPEWNPTFLWPQPAQDRRGMVFTVQHGASRVPWVSTQFDLEAGRIQYVYVVAETMVTVITLRLKAEGQTTRVRVDYDRTALSSEANHLVASMAQHDEQSGPIWDHQINAYLVKSKANG